MTELSANVKELANKQNLDIAAVRAVAEQLSQSEDLIVEGDRLVVRSGRSIEPLDSFARRNHPSLADGVDPASAQKNAVGKALANQISMTQKACLPQ